MKKYKKTIILIVLIIILILLDQGLKLCSHTITYQEVNNEVGHSSSIVSYVITNIIAIGIIIKFFVNQKDKIGTNLVIMIAFLLSGGISNLIDKLFKGNIVNYIKLYNLPAINLAFVFIVLGWIGLAAIFAWNTYKEIKEKQNKQDVK